MTAEKRKEPTELERLEDALVDSILGMSETEIRDELREAGEDPDLLIRDFDTLLLTVKSTCAVAALRNAQAQVQAYQQTAARISEAEHLAAKAKLLKPANDSRMLLAARQGKSPSERDLDSLADDYAELERLEGTEGETDNDPC